MQKPSTSGIFFTPATVDPMVANFCKKARDKKYPGLRYFYDDLIGVEFLQGFVSRLHKGYSMHGLPKIVHTGNQYILRHFSGCSKSLIKSIKNCELIYCPQIIFLEHSVHIWFIDAHRQNEHVSNVLNEPTLICDPQAYLLEDGDKLDSKGPPCEDLYVYCGAWKHPSENCLIVFPYRVANLLDDIGKLEEKQYRIGGNFITRTSAIDYMSTRFMEVQDSKPKSLFFGDKETMQKYFNKPTETSRNKSLDCTLVFL